MAYILAADVGGTKIRLGLFDKDREFRQPVKEDILPSKDFSNFLELVNYFLEEDQFEVDSVCLGVAGPVRGDAVRLTNLPWTIEREEITKYFGTDSVFLINDLQATAYSIHCLADQDIEELSPGKRIPEGNIGIIAPGTGLGMAFIIQQDGKRIVSASEGGHSSFAPADSLEIGLLDYHRKNLGQVSYEDFCSGKGIPLIYDYLQNSRDYKSSEIMQIKPSIDEDLTPLIASAAMDREKDNPLCRDTMELFSLILAGACTRLALTVLATGGLYIGGGIPPRILPLLRKETFLQRFKNNRRMGYLLEDIPLKVILNHKAPLLGAAAWAREN